MTSDPQRAQALFLVALELSDPAARHSFLDRECAGYDPLRQRVEALLRAHDAAAGFGDESLWKRAEEVKVKANSQTKIE